LSLIQRDAKKKIKVKGKKIRGDSRGAKDMPGATNHFSKKENSCNNRRSKKALLQESDRSVNESGRERHSEKGP